MNRNALFVPIVREIYIGSCTQGVYNLMEVDEVCLYITVWYSYAKWWNICATREVEIQKRGDPFSIGTRKRFLVEVVFHMVLGMLICAPYVIFGEVFKSLSNLFFFSSPFYWVLRITYFGFKSFSRYMICK